MVGDNLSNNLNVVTVGVESPPLLDNLLRKIRHPYQIMASVGPDKEGLFWYTLNLSPQTKIKNIIIRKQGENNGVKV